jgi:CBS domain-containing protein
MLAKITIGDYMTKHVVTLSPETEVKEAIKKMLALKITSVPVLDQNGYLVGIFSEKDCMKVVLEQAYNQGASPKIGEYMSHHVVTVDVDSSIVDLAENFQTSTLRSFPVMDGSELVGIISRADVLKALVTIS